MSAPVVIGFLAQCAKCPQQAMVATQPERGWVCPRCTEFNECAASVESGHDIGLSAAAEAAAAMFPQHRGRAGGFGDVDVLAAEPDHYPIQKVRG